MAYAWFCNQYFFATYSSHSVPVRAKKYQKIGHSFCWKLCCVMQSCETLEYKTNNTTKMQLTAANYVLKIGKQCHIGTTTNLFKEINKENTHLTTVDCSRKHDSYDTKVLIYVVLSWSTQMWQLKKQSDFFATNSLYFINISKFLHFKTQFQSHNLKI